MHSWKPSSPRWRCGSARAAPRRGYAAWAFGPDRHLVLDEHVGAATNPAVDHDAGRVDEDKARPELGAPADDAVVAHGVELVAKQFQRDDPPSPCPLHEAVDDHRGRAVGK